MGSFSGLRLNPQGVRAVMREPGVREMLLKRMQRVAAQANTNAPVGETGYDEEGNPQIHMMVDATDLVLTMQSEGTFEQPMYYAELYNT